MQGHGAEGGATERPGQQLQLKPRCRVPESQPGSSHLSHCRPGTGEWAGSASSEMGWGGAQGEVGPRQRLRGSPVNDSVSWGGPAGSPIPEAQAKPAVECEANVLRQVPHFTPPMRPTLPHTRSLGPERGAGPLSSVMLQAKVWLR
ncbi:hypothetical protein HJG60_008870 [Phyllostomus discolor]|uniref:Uncharacterized protein n=1 Tax=Phyllostomus discolor TaxID=89673 RepID=A0A833YWN7_9CHIR|nr:hypothetical protein HJG60_008870 [Phyllostomus discolor]